MTPNFDVLTPNDIVIALLTGMLQDNSHLGRLTVIRELCNRAEANEKNNRRTTTTASNPTPAKPSERPAVSSAV